MAPAAQDYMFMAGIVSCMDCSLWVIDYPVRKHWKVVTVVARKGASSSVQHSLVYIFWHFAREALNIESLSMHVPRINCGSD